MNIVPRIVRLNYEGRMEIYYFYEHKQYRTWLSLPPKAQVVVLRIDILLYFQPIEALFIVTACAAAPFVGFVYRDCVRRRSICWVCCRINKYNKKDKFP